VIRPELPLRRCTFRCFGCPKRFGAKYRVVPEDEPDLTVGEELLLQLSPRTQGETLAERSLEVAPLLDEDGGVRAAFGLSIYHLGRRRQASCSLPGRGRRN
jgi:hypothetical protein